MTSLRSEYGSGDDEADIFRLITETVHPLTDDEDVGNQEEEHLSSGNYDDMQEEFDATESRLRNLADTLPRLPDEVRDRIIDLLDEILPR